MVEKAELADALQAIYDQMIRYAPEDPTKEGFWQNFQILERIFDITLSDKRAALDRQRARQQRQEPAMSVDAALTLLDKGAVENAVGSVNQAEARVVMAVLRQELERIAKPPEGAIAPAAEAPEGEPSADRVKVAIAVDTLRGAMHTLRPSEWSGFTENLRRLETVLGISQAEHSAALNRSPLQDMNAEAAFQVLIQPANTAANSDEALRILEELGQALSNRMRLVEAVVRLESAAVILPGSDRARFLRHLDTLASVGIFHITDDEKAHVSQRGLAPDMNIEVALAVLQGAAQTKTKPEDRRDVNEALEALERTLRNRGVQTGGITGTSITDAITNAGSSEAVQSQHEQLLGITQDATGRTHDAVAELRDITRKLRRRDILNLALGAVGAIATTTEGISWAMHAGRHADALAGLENNLQYSLFQRSMALRAGVDPVYVNPFVGAENQLKQIQESRPIPGGIPHTNYSFEQGEQQVLMPILRQAVEEGAGSLVLAIARTYPNFISEKLIVSSGERTVAYKLPDYVRTYYNAANNTAHIRPDTPRENLLEQMTPVRGR